MNRKILLLSGGLDSAGALIKTMQTTTIDEKIRVFHVDYRNSMMALAQKAALRQLMIHVPNWDIYTYPTEDIDVKEPLNVCLKAMLTFGTGNFLEGSQLGEEVSSLELIVGYEYDEEDSCTIVELNEAVQLLRSAYIKTGVGILPVTVTSPVSNLTKLEIKELLGDSTFWSCRSPNVESPHTFVPCGNCSTCKQLAKYGIIHPSITPEYTTLARKGGL